MNLDTEQTAREYLSNVASRLHGQGFQIISDIRHRSQLFGFVARRSRFEVEKYSRVATFLVFSRFRSPEIRVLREFSSDAFNYATRASRVRPPRGLFYAIVCFPVAVVDTVDEATSQAIRRKAPPKHWASFEMPVVCCLQDHSLHYPEISPIWGHLHYDQLRETIRETLTS
jgi:hypothetical protein